MDFLQLKKNLKKPTDGFPTIRIAVLCDFTSQLLVQALEGTGIAAGLKYEIFEADFDQIDVQVLNPGSELYRFAPSYVLILRSTEKLLAGFYVLSLEQRRNFALTTIAHTQRLYLAITSRLKAGVLTNTYYAMDDAVFGNYATRIDSSFRYQVCALNLALMDLSRRVDGLFLADFDTVISRIGRKTAFDAKLFINADMVFSLDALPALAKCLHDVLQALTGRFRKCLILDLDNTVWGGIIGEDGMEGIQIGSLGIGKAFTALQWWVRELRNRGILLAVCSKNTESVAKEPFEKHPDMILRLNDFAVFTANWENKVTNIRDIQGVLNISFGSMVFLDDNPFEREMVRKALPGISVPEVPDDPAEWLPFLREMNLFETASFTEEDLDRTAQYQAESERTAIRESFDNEDEFLDSLGMYSEVRPFERFSIPRVAQLSQRSNQFNLRTVRYTPGDIAGIAASPDHLTLSFTLKDSLGDSGLISAVILGKQEKKLFIDTWIMSCRILQRGMENFVLNTLVELAASRGFTHLVGEYIPTARNEMVKDLYRNLGFTADGALYTLEIAGYHHRKTFIKRQSNGVV